MCAPSTQAQVGPFEVWPLYFDLQRGDEVTLSAGFEPNAIGRHEERFVMVCDNCQARGVEVFVRGGMKWVAKLATGWVRTACQLRGPAAALLQTSEGATGKEGVGGQAQPASRGGPPPADRPADAPTDRPSRPPPQVKDFKPAGPPTRQPTN
jgi:hypothetical protein